MFFQGFVPKIRKLAGILRVPLSKLYEGQEFADEVIGWRRQRDFSLGGVYNMSCDNDGKALQADFLFRPAGSAA